MMFRFFLFSLIFIISCTQEEHQLDTTNTLDANKDIEDDTYIDCRTNVCVCDPKIFLDTYSCCPHKTFPSNTYYSCNVPIGSSEGVWQKVTDEKIICPAKDYPPCPWAI